MIAVGIWTQILNGLGAALAWFYKYIPNYGVAIILLTLVIRVLLLPLGIKQIRSMQQMQMLQPKLKQLQQKYKGNRQKVTEETMALYKEHGVNPLSGCLPMLLQFPVLIALFYVLKVPSGAGHVPHVTVNTRSPNYAANSRLFNDIAAQRTGFLGANLLCTALEAGKEVPLPPVKKGEPPQVIQGTSLHCGKGGASRLPYYAFALVMIGSQFLVQKQMSGMQQQSQQAQTITRMMPILFGIWGFIFPAGLVVYWTVSNLIQYGQQLLLPKPTLLTEAERGASGDGGRGSTPGGGRGGQRGTPARGGRPAERRPGPARGDGRGGQRGSGGSRLRDAQRGGSEPGRGGRAGGAAGQVPPAGERGSGGGPRPRPGGGGGQDGGDRKKRRKR